MKVRITALLLFVLSGSCVAEGVSGCDAIESTEEISKELAATVHSEYYPSETEIIAACRIGSRTAVFTSLVWGNLRETKRVALFNNDGEYLGNYGVPELPVSIVDEKLIFSFREDQGNSIDLSQDEVPQQVFLDAEFVYFEGVSP